MSDKFLTTKTIEMKFETIDNKIKVCRYKKRKSWPTY